MLDREIAAHGFPSIVRAQGDRIVNWRDHIDRHPDVLGGKPRIAGTRIGVELVLKRLGDGWTREQLLQAYPHIHREQIQACLSFAAESLRTDDVLDVPLSAA